MTPKQFMVLLCATGIVICSPLPLNEDVRSMEESESGEPVKKTVCISYDENTAGEVESNKTERPFSLIVKTMFGKSSPRIVKYKILTVDGSEEDTLTETDYVPAPDNVTAGHMNKTLGTAKAVVRGKSSVKSSPSSSELLVDQDEGYNVNTTDSSSEHTRINNQLGLNTTNGNFSTINEYDRNITQPSTENNLINNEHGLNTTNGNFSTTNEYDRNITQPSTANNLINNEHGLNTTNGNFSTNEYDRNITQSSAENNGNFSTTNEYDRNITQPSTENNGNFSTINEYDRNITQPSTEYNGNFSTTNEYDRNITQPSTENNLINNEHGLNTTNGNFSTTNEYDRNITQPSTANNLINNEHGLNTTNGNFTTTNEYIMNITQLSAENTTINTQQGLNSTNGNLTSTIVTKAPVDSFIANGTLDETFKLAQSNVTTNKETSQPIFNQSIEYNYPVKFNHTNNITELLDLKVLNASDITYSTQAASDTQYNRVTDAPQSLLHFNTSIPSLLQENYTITTSFSHLNNSLPTSIPQYTTDISENDVSERILNSASEDPTEPTGGETSTASAVTVLDDNFENPFIALNSVLSGSTVAGLNKDNDIFKSEIIDVTTPTVLSTVAQSNTSTSDSEISTGTVLNIMGSTTSRTSVTTDETTTTSTPTNMSTESTSPDTTDFTTESLVKITAAEVVEEHNGTSNITSVQNSGEQLPQDLNDADDVAPSFRIGVTDTPIKEDAQRTETAEYSLTTAQTDINETEDYQYADNMKQGMTLPPEVIIGPSGNVIGVLSEEDPNVMTTSTINAPSSTTDRVSSSTSHDDLENEIENQPIEDFVEHRENKNLNKPLDNDGENDQISGNKQLDEFKQLGTTVTVSDRVYTIASSDENTNNRKLPAFSHKFEDNKPMDTDHFDGSSIPQEGITDYSSRPSSQQSVIHSIETTPHPHSELSSDVNHWERFNNFTVVFPTRASYYGQPNPRNSFHNSPRQYYHFYPSPGIMQVVQMPDGRIV